MTTNSMTLPRRLRRSEEPEWVVWLVVILLLVAGLFLKISIEGRTRNFSGSGVSISYPAEWVQLTGEGQLLYVADPFSSAQFPTGVSVYQVPVEEVGRNLTTLGDVAAAWAIRQGQDKQVYRVLSIEPASINGQNAVRVEYAYIPQTVPGVHTGTVPVVARAQDYLVRQGESLTIITLAAVASVFETKTNQWQAVLDTVQIQ